MKVLLKIIPTPPKGTRAVLIPQTPPAIKGEGPIKMYCENCHTILVDGVYENQIRNIVIKCPKCGFYNEIY